MGTKVCPKCKEEKPYSLFYKCKSSKINCSPYCKVCSNLRTTSYAKDNKGKLQPKTVGYSLKRRYGITSDDYVALLEKQHYKCAICRLDQCKTGRNFAVDHCHATGKIRGLLCSACNVGIGNLQDSVDLLEKAIKYLKEKYS